MENYNELFGTQESLPEKQQESKSSYDKDKWIKETKEKRDQLYKTANETVEKVFSDPGQFKAYLDLESRLSKTSAFNLLLVLAQKPEAVRVKDFDEWGRKGRNVISGEKGFFIMVPGKQYTKRDGSSHMNFKAKTVFDESQTSGKEMPSPRPAAIKAVIRAMTTEMPVKLKISEEIGEKDVAAFIPEDNTIYVRPDIPQEEALRCISRELAIANMMKRKGYEASQDFAAACASYVCCKHCGIDAELPDVPEEYRTLDNKAKRGVLGDIREAASETIDRIEHNLYAERHRNEEAR